MTPSDLRTWTILLTLAGSRAYGIHTSTSDVDLKGVAIPPRAYFHGYLHRFEQADKPGHMAAFSDLLSSEEGAAATQTKVEGSVYDIRKFTALAADCNPNILDVLFCRDAEVRLAAPLGEKLRENRELFLSAKAKHTFSGYAAAQLKRIRGHRAWLLDPPRGPPARADFGLPDLPTIPADHIAAAQAAIRKQIDQWEWDFSGMSGSAVVQIEAQIAAHLGEIRAALGFTSEDEMRWTAAARFVGLDDNLMEVMQKEREYGAAARHWKQYQDWKAERNADRASLEAQYGYDCKHGAHLVRLLRMGREILETGRVHVYRGKIDGDELRAIRQGAWPYDQLVSWAESEDEALTALYRARKYAVPHEPDRARIDRLCVDLVDAALSA